MFSGLGSILAGVNASTVSGLVGAAATSAAASWLVNGFNQQLGQVLGQVLPHPAATNGQVPTVPVLSAAQLNALTPAAQSAFFAAGGHVIG